MSKAIKQARFQTARLAAGLTQQEAATLLDVPVGTLRHWEQKDKAPPFAYKALVLLTWQVKLRRWRPAKGDERSALELDVDGEPLSILMDQEAFDDFAATLQKAHYGGAGGGKKK